MVFENLTLFEVHLDGASFTAGRTSDDSGNAEHQASDESTADGGESGGRGFPMKLAFVGLVLATTAFAVRRYRSDPQTTVEEFADDESGDADAVELDDIDA